MSALKDLFLELQNAYRVLSFKRLNLSFEIAQLYATCPKNHRDSM
jgi:hypothetical protein